MDERAQRWILDAVKGLDREMSQDACARVLEQCGRSCLPAGLREMAEAIGNKSETPSEAIEQLAKKIDVMRIEDDAIYMEYPECYCEHLQGVPAADTPDVFCQCSIGWIKELFEAATGRSVNVTLEESVVRGGSRCRFRVLMS